VVKNLDPEVLDKIRQQFDVTPYPRIPIETPLVLDPNELFIHSFVTPVYLRDQQVISTDGKIILDVGCGTGVTSHFLALANPGAKIIGIDLSPASIDIAKQRLKYHGYENAEFYAMPVEEVEKIGMMFDFIHCDEVLYLLPDLSAAMLSLAQVLKPDGILRGNLHSRYQRQARYRAQSLFKMMGLMENNPDDFEVEVALQTIGSLRSTTRIKEEIWHDVQDGSMVKETVLTNWLLQGDKGFTVPEMFQVLDRAGLTFITMTNWKQWDLLSLFESPDDLPMYWAMSWEHLSIAQQLEMFELMNPVHRLLDFWCGKGQSVHADSSLSEWSDDRWMKSTIFLHPSLVLSDFRRSLKQAVETRSPFRMNQDLNCVCAPEIPFYIDSNQVSFLLDILDGPCQFVDLLEHYQSSRTGQQTGAMAFVDLQALICSLETYLYVLVQG
jgi:2-polyprenyl-3-methyl-5-hydroxy-6-metoxy-1,4-benzoquinol methylase